MKKSLEKTIETLPQSIALFDILGNRARNAQFRTRPRAGTLNDRISDTELTSGTSNVIGSKGQGVDQ